MKKAYLLAYNAACALGWAFCTLRAALLAASGARPAEVYQEVGWVLTAVQSAMLLEILHSLLGLVPSPVVMVAIQVSSRVFVLWGHLYWVPECQQHWSLLLLVLSWGVTEVVRYLFYFFGLLGSVPYALFYLRYSLFMVLYPTGITGELFQVLVGMGARWQAANPLWYRLSLITLILYVPGSPGMIGNMWINRKRSFKKRKAAGQQPEGAVWPVTAQGDRSSTATNRGILAAAARAGPRGAEAATRVLKEKKWRFSYNKHVLEHVAQSLESADGCLAMARAGLDAAQDTFQFRREGAEEMSMRAAMERFGTSAFDTAELVGSGEQPSKRELALSYGGPTAGQPYYQFKAKRHDRISGLKLREQLDAWVEYGTIEPDVANALKLVQQNQDAWLDLSGRCFVLLGAGSAMGPLRCLLALGADVVAVARPRALKSILREAQASPGRLLFPVRKGADWRGLAAAGDLDGLCGLGGCDLLAQAPEIAAWLAAVAPGKALTVGNYTYLDGAAHVQLAVACDCIMARVCQARSDTSLAFLGTPTDAHPVPREAVEAVAASLARVPLWMQVWQALGVLQPTKVLSAGGMSYLDAIVPDQGPNYILAKRMQHWRALAARADGHTVSTNVSPSTATASVTSNASFAAAYGGMHIFRPMEVAYEELSSTIMAALLIHDLRNPKSTANASQALPHPMCLFSATSVHFGVWRCPYSINTIGIPSAILYYLSTFWAYILIAGALVFAMVQYTALGSLPAPMAALLSAVPDGAWEPLRSLARALAVPL